MIRATDLASAPLWARTSSTATPRADARDAASWFDATSGVLPATICGALGPESRGLSVEQHAQRVLMHLRDDSDRRA